MDDVDATIQNIHACIQHQDANVVLNTTDKQPWEGQQGVDSMAPYSLGQGRGYAAFYGSAGRPPNSTTNQTTFQMVGLARADSLAGPWTRVPNNPVNLSATVPNIEQPMTSRLRDGSFVTFYDTLTKQGQGVVGYSWSPDGLTWHPGCSQNIEVAHGVTGAQDTWASVSGVTRTPQVGTRRVHKLRSHVNNCL